VAKKTIVHRGYHGSIEVDIQDYSLHGQILFIEEESSYRGDTFAELEIAFQQAVEQHIKKCVTRGEQPPFS
jgi:predicted HicB family RNase H-like nuclease